MFTVAQALKLGMTRDRVAQLAGAERILHTGTRGVYRFAGAPEDVGVDDLRAAWLSLNPSEFAGRRLRTLYEQGTDAVVSHLSAAHYVHRLGTLHPDRLDFTIRPPRRTSNRRITLHDNTAAAWELVSGLPVTTIPQTVADLYRDSIDAAHLGEILADALATAAADVAAISAALDPLTDYHGREVLADLLAAAGAPETIAAANELLFSARR
ncbi:hypothetical protein C0J29_31715 (plasmid) [Mycobacterium paragordonae]|nr:hypothetical protein C0J29_31715 [Mycobacterium paragordonae]QNI09804.1 hypothetical protein GAN17_25600 [Mycobacterium kubicae]